jgi:putative flippase GtrA
MSVVNSACFCDEGNERKDNVSSPPAAEASPLRALVARLPRPLRFLAVGGIGLATDIVLFTAMVWLGLDPLVAGFLALVAATVVTWRLNRAFTFARSGRRQGEEAVRYAAVTVVAQGTSYAVFAVLVLTTLSSLPQAAIIAGAAVGALISYNGQRLFAFAPKASVAAARP